MGILDVIVEVMKSKGAPMTAPEIYKAVIAYNADFRRRFTGKGDYIERYIRRRCPGVKIPYSESKKYFLAVDDKSYSLLDAPVTDEVPSVPRKTKHHLPASTFREHVSSLAGSAMFNFSLASKELFHSNFLAWLCELYPSLVGPIFARFTMGACPSCDKLKVLRERRNFDLTIKFPNGESLIVENKVKSIPSEEQLKEYSDKVAGKEKEHTGFLLLSLTRPSFFQSGDGPFQVNGTAWHFLSYKELARQLEPTKDRIAALDKYHGELVEDYLGFVRSLDAIASHISVKWDDDEDDFFRDEERELLGNIRLRDLMDKIRYAQLDEKIKEGLRAEGCYVVPKEDDLNNAGDFAAHAAFYRGEATCEFKYLARAGDNPVYLSVMLQGNALKVFVGVPKSKDAAKRLATELVKPRAGGKLWFDFASIGGDRQEMPVKGFNQYVGTWLYRYKRIEKSSPKALVQVFMHYARAIRDAEDAIRNEIERAYEST